MKFIIWMMVLFWAAIFALNLRALHTLQEWIFSIIGYTFRPRRSKNRKGKFFIKFSPAVSDKAVEAIRAEIRSWKLHLRSDKSIEDLSRMFNPVGALSADAATGSISGPLGLSEIQEAARPFAQGDALDRAPLATGSKVVGALAAECGKTARAV
jgi:hypothetical protein